MPSRNKSSSRATSGAAEIIRRRYIQGRPEMETILEEERANAELARLIHDFRVEAGLTQKELAARVGTSPSVISRLESADYGGHSLSMLHRIAAAVGKRIQIGFVSSGEPPAEARERSETTSLIPRQKRASKMKP